MRHEEWEGRWLTPGMWAVPSAVRLVSGTIVSRVDGFPRSYEATTLDGSRWRVSWDLFESEPEHRQLSAEPPPEPLLTAFARLHDAEASDIVKFVRRWGTLRLCNVHSMPGPHKSVDPRAAGVLSRSDTPLDGCQWDIDAPEPIEAWRYWSGAARALVTISLSLNRGQVGSEEDWSVVLSGPPPITDRAGLAKPGQSVSRQRAAAASAMNTWLQLSAPTMQVRWQQRKRPALEFWPGGLFGALAHQLVLAASGAEHLRTCAGCERLHVPARPSNATSFCPECRTAGVPARLRQKRSYAKKKEDPTYLPSRADKARARRASARG